MQIFLVGGSVRDELMGRTGQDRDFVVIGASEEMFLQRFPLAKKVGNRKYVYLLGRDEYSLSSADTIEEDLMGRDLTINALARDMDGHIFAHPKAFEDLKNRLLRPISQANFMNDPLRVFRAARLASQLPDFQADPSLFESMTSVVRKGLLANVAAERVGNEVRKACAGARPGRFFRILEQAEALSPWLDEIHLSKSVPAGPPPYHLGSVFDHLLALADALKGEALTVWMAVCHDLGKIATNPGQCPAHNGPAGPGATPAETIGKRLRLPQRFIRAGIAAARWHTTAARYAELRPGTKVRLLMNLHRIGLIREIFNLVKADSGYDHLLQIEQDLKRILSVRLPELNQGLGPESGILLHQLRCRQLNAVLQKEMGSACNQTI